MDETADTETIRMGFGGLVLSICALRLTWHAAAGLLQALRATAAPRGRGRLARDVLSPERIGFTILLQ
jgi:hypothetical protein